MNASCEDWPVSARGEACRDETQTTVVPSIVTDDRTIVQHGQDAILAAYASLEGIVINAGFVLFSSQTRNERRVQLRLDSRHLAVDFVLT
jgi:hypothetical protein